MENDFILVLDLGGPQAVTMARKLRYQRYYTEIISRHADIGLFRRKAPRGILIVGGEDGKPAQDFPGAVLALGIPVLAMGAAARMMAEADGAVSQGTLLEDCASQIRFSRCPLFEGLTESDRYFERIDGYELPSRYQPVATTMDGLVPAFADFSRDLYGLQFYPESNDPDGAAILTNFAERICGCTPFWQIDAYIEEEIRYIREKIGDGSALMVVSGGVDSSACAMLMRRAIGERLKCVYIDNGLMRQGETEQVLDTFRNDMELSVICVDARERFLSRLKGVSDPLEKHRIIRGEFLSLLTEIQEANPECEFVVRGTIYSDLISAGASDEADVRRLESGQLLEPIRMLFKNEVRTLARALGAPESVACRQAFPETGLGTRCCGEITEDKLRCLRQADAIFREEIVASGMDRKLSIAFAVLTNTLVRASAAYEDRYGYAIALRAVSIQGPNFSIAKLPYDLLDRVTDQILREIPEVGRVTLDISSSPVAIEWE